MNAAGEVGNDGYTRTKRRMRHLNEEQPQAVCEVLCSWPPLANFIILQMRKLKFKKFRKLIQGQQS